MTTTKNKAFRKTFFQNPKNVTPKKIKPRTIALNKQKRGFKK